MAYLLADKKEIRKWWGKFTAHESCLRCECTTETWNDRWVLSGDQYINWAFVCTQCKQAGIDYHAPVGRAGVLLHGILMEHKPMDLSKILELYEKYYLIYLQEKLLEVNVPES